MTGLANHVESTSPVLGSTALLQPGLQMRNNVRVPAFFATILATRSLRTFTAYCTFRIPVVMDRDARVLVLPVQVESLFSKIIFWRLKRKAS
jgi:hypothetical protein